ncbi:MAG: hypothetical protein J6Y02_10035 [Pseudobutyrivibrio sp.]|nr:hypothetical protein [Pseudobutyrivibrio sp.]
MSSSKREGEDSGSQFDKFESHLIRTDEALYMQNKVNCESAMSYIENLFGPFDPDEIEFYKKELTKNNKVIINNFQKNLVFNLFYKYFGDPVSINAINVDQYVELIIAARKILETNGMVMLPYIISSRVNRVVDRNSINKKELLRLESSQYFPYIKQKYRNDKIEQYILKIIATIISSEFVVIDPNDPGMNGRNIETIPEYIIEEVLLYIQLI